MAVLVSPHGWTFRLLKLGYRDVLLQSARRFALGYELFFFFCLILLINGQTIDDQVQQKQVVEQWTGILLVFLVPYMEGLC